MPLQSDISGSIWTFFAKKERLSHRDSLSRHIIIVPDSYDLCFCRYTLGVRPVNF